MENKQDNWRLKRITVYFQEGFAYSTEESKKVDRYEGSIEFENGVNESFSFAVKPNMAEKYISLIADDVIDAAQQLGNRLALSIKTRNDEPNQDDNAKV